MNLPPSILEIVHKVTEKYPDDIQEATDAAIKQIKNLSDYQSFVNGLVHMAIRDQIYQRRHQVNVKLRREAGGYDTTNKHSPAESSVVEGVYRSCHDYFIAGRTLGDLLGNELAEVESSERAIANGHLFNANLLAELRPLVKAEKRVREVVKEAQLRRLFQKVRRQINQTAAS